METMIHYFYIDMATKLGVYPAILYQNFVFWCDKNKANGKNLYDGNYWTYNSVEAYQQLFPYMTLQQIRDSIDKLVETGYLCKGHYGENKLDRTCWYAVTKNAKNDENMHSSEVECIWSGEQMHLVSGTNVYTDNKQESKDSSDIYPPTKKHKHPTVDEVSLYIKQRAKDTGKKDSDICDAKFFVDYYSAGDWHDSQGQPIKNWKLKILSVWEGKDWWKKQLPAATTVSKDYEDVLHSFRDAMESIGLDKNKDWKNNIADCSDEIRLLKDWYKSKKEDLDFYWKNVNSEWPALQTTISAFWGSYLGYIANFVSIPKPANFKVDSPTFKGWIKEMRIII